MKNKVIVFTFVIYLFFFSIAHVLIKDKIVSETERRKLTNFPQFKLESDFITNIEDYLLDHFPFREKFRNLKAAYNYKILNQLENNKIYIKDNYIFKSEYPTNKKSISYFKQNINKISKNFTEENRVFLLTVPDKNYYLNDKNFLQINYDYLYNELSFPQITNIDIRNIMELEDYYETDTHWKQEKLNKVVKMLSSYLNFEYQEYQYKENKFDNFYGVYYGESAVSRNPETITYLTNYVLDNSKVIYLENKNLNNIYNIEKLNSLDSYEVFLDGASSFIEIYNDFNLKNRELIVFRDSFGSSLVPLLIPYYSKIIVIDNRYITSDNFKKFVKFTNQDILFLYSTLIINNSYSLKG